MLFLSSFVVSSFLLVASVPIGNTGSHKPRTIPDHHGDVPLESLWAQFAPYTSAAPANKKYAVSSGCTINQVNLVQRHGSRYPTPNQNNAIKTAVENVQKVLPGDTVPEFKFLHAFDYPIKTDDAGNLTEIGKKESFESGQLQYSRYKHLMTGKSIFVHSSSIHRVQKSAEQWIEGVQTAKGWAQGDRIQSPKIIEKQPDEEAAAVVKTTYVNPWKKIYLPPIREALDKTLKVKLTNEDVYGLMFMCPFHTSMIREGDTSSKKLSPFCKIFTVDQFKDFAWQDFAWQGALDKYYIGKSKYPSEYELSPLGYTKNLRTRLETSKESDIKFYADFSHDNEMAGIFNVLGLFRQKEDLSHEKRDDSSTYKVSRIVPFGTRMVVERLTCTSKPSGSKGKRSGGSIKDDSKEFVRVLVNDDVQPLEWCHGAKDGLCEVKEFIKGPK